MGNDPKVDAETEARRRFDAAAATWDEEPRRVGLANDVAAAILREGILTPEMDVMDYGCGTGLLTLRLQPRVGTITAVDSSPGMLKVLAGKIEGLGLRNVFPRAIDLERDDYGDERFHAIVSSMTLHHIREPELLLARFHSLLSPGGYLCIADLDKEDGSFHDDAAGVEHSGFEAGEMEEMFRRVGFTDVRSSIAATIVKGEARVYPVNLVVGKRAP